MCLKDNVKGSGCQPQVFKGNWEHSTWTRSVRLPTLSHLISHAQNFPVQDKTHPPTLPCETSIHTCFISINQVLQNTLVYTIWSWLTVLISIGNILWMAVVWLFPEVLQQGHIHSQQLSSKLLHCSRVDTHTGPWVLFSFLMHYANSRWTVLFAMLTHSA